MRLAGKITEWNDDKGFGFVVPNGGGDRAFVHVKAFQPGSRRPVTGDLISYLPARDARGRLQATEVRHADRKIEAPRSSSGSVPCAVVGATALVLILILAGLDVVPNVLAVGVCVVSLLTFLSYWIDKSAAQGGRRRIPESNLHLLSLAGGWPGALIAQQLFRHKTIKQPFQSVFWATVVLNVAGFAWLVGSGTLVKMLG